MQLSRFGIVSVITVTLVLQVKHTCHDVCSSFVPLTFSKSRWRHLEAIKKTPTHRALHADKDEMVTSLLPKEPDRRHHHHAATPLTPLTKCRQACFRAREGLLPCKAEVADVPGPFVGHTTSQRLSGIKQLSSPDAGGRPQTVTFAGTHKTLQLHLWFFPPREPGDVYIRI